MRRLLAMALFAMLAPHVWANSVEDAEKSEERARAAFTEQFTKFTQDKNVQGRAKTPDGKIVGGGKKTRFNPDDGLNFQSDLTYHDYAYVKQIEGDAGGPTPAGQPGQKPKEFLQPWVSEHGAIGAAGGSSVLERTAYQFAQQYKEQDKQAQNQPETPGVRNRSIFTITTKEVFDQAQAGAGGAQMGANPEMEKDKVDRWELRPEVRQAITKVGDDSFQTILQSARGEGAENDPQALPNGVYLRQGAYEATKALWNATLANRAQRTIFRAVPRSGALGKVETSEGAPNCESWSQAAVNAINGQANLKPEDKQRYLQDAQRMTQQCKQVSALPFNMIAPVFKPDEQGQETLQSDGPLKEEAFQRDTRIQLELLANTSKSITDVPSNWQYTKEDEKARVTIRYDDNQPREGSMTMKEQVQSYNQNLKDAEVAYQEVGSRIPGLAIPKPTDYAIPEGTSLRNINQPPAAAYEEVGMRKNNPEATGPVPQTYEQLLQAAQTN